MANPKLYGEFRSDHGNFYLIEIWDKDYTGNDPDRFNVTGGGFELNYSGQTDNIYSPVIGSSVSFGMYIKDAATRAFEAEFKNYQENRYYVKIWKGQYDGQDSDKWYNTSKVSDDGLVMNFSPDEEELVYLDFFWGGYILQDIVKIEDAAEPYVLQIEANDGIAKLKNVDAQEGIGTIQNLFSNAIFSAYTFNILPTEWPALKMISNWWSEQHTYDANENPLETTSVDVNVFHNFNADGTVNLASYYDVLVGVCRIFGLRFYFSNGSYRAEQIFQRDGSSLKEFSYKRNGNLIGYESVTRDKTLDQTSNKARLAGNIFNFLPAVNEVRIQTSEKGLDYKGVVSTHNASPIIDLGYTPGSSVDNFLEITFTYKVTMTSNVTDNPQFLWYILDVDIIQDDGTTVYYLQRDHNKLKPLSQTWTTTQADGGYQVLVGRFIERTDLSPQRPSGTFTIVTPYLQTDGDITVQFNSNRFIKADGTTKVLNPANIATWKTEIVSIQKSIGTNGYDIRSTTTKADNDSGIIYSLGETKIFDGPGTEGSLYKRNANLTRTLTTGWREGNSGSYITAQRLVANEFLSLMNTPVQKYEGTIFSSHNFMTRLIFQGKNWLQLGGRFIANSDEWDGEWFAISKETITITDTDTGTAGDPVFSIGGNNGTGEINIAALDVNDFTANDASVDNNVTVGNDLDVTGNTDVTGTLDVTGNSTLSATSVGEFTTTGRVNVTLNEVTGAPGGSETLSASNNFNFIDFESGENGTYTLNLPSSEPGLIMRFKTDGTIAANKTISLTPQSGERIDGEDSYSMDRPYDGITLMGGPSGDWFVIQKKEK